MRNKIIINNVVYSYAKYVVYLLKVTCMYTEV